MIDLNAKTASKIANEYEAGLDFGQFQNLAVSGDFIYVPLTPTGEAGRLYAINWKTKEVTKGAILTGQSGSSYLGSYYATTGCADAAYSRCQFVRNR